MEVKRKARKNITCRENNEETERIGVRKINAMKQNKMTLKRL